MTSPDLVRALAPTGTLRASINLGNPILARADGDGAAGVSVDLARELGRELGVPVELITFSKAAASVEAVRAGRADVGFFAIDPARSDGLGFTAPYVLIEGSYVVPDTSPVQGNDDVDREGTTVAVGAGSAYDLFLTRALSAAMIERVDGAPAVLRAVRAGAADVGAGIRQVLAGWVADESGLRMLPGRFMVIQQAMGLPADRGEPARALLADFVERAKASGAVSDALARHGIAGASVAPPA